MSLLTLVLQPLAYLGIFLAALTVVLPPKAAFYARATLYVGTLFWFATGGAVMAGVMFILGYKYSVNMIVTRIFYYLSSTVMGVYVEVEGREHLEGPNVLMMNHQSFVDLIMIGNLIPNRTSIMAKKSIQFTPLGMYMYFSGSVLIDRGNNERAVRSMKTAAETMQRQKLSVWMFPEGTRHMSGAVNELLPFKKGGFHLALQADTPIVPIVVENYHWLYRKGFFGRGVIKVKVLPPIATKGLTAEDCNDLVAKVRAQMLDTYQEISRPPVASTKPKVQ